ncbi:outer membrane protein [Salinimicrobium catena]|uniref:Outer membrane protein n=1 Tax=Salinimicrobium catena TaxID=390640 RepID=A0A1H5H4D0_9FLAO|nr:TolC family protein [Salinimicrobium catena]SDK67671.1 outer membrane protein [Salinimicrobium catena]SEE22846.1 outer membrane protein [Salinimicrobium catena]
MKKLLLPVLFLFFGINVNAQNKEWTLEECVAYALENNISIKQSELEVELAEIDRAEAVGNFLPRLNASASNSWNTGLTQNVTTGILQTQTTRNFSAGATASANLSSGLSNWKRLQLAKLSQLASEYSLEQMKDDIALFVANAYLQVLFNKESLKVIEAQHEITLEQLERVQELVEAGSLPRGDLLEIKATAANEEQRMIVAANNVKVSLIALAQTLLIKDYENFDIAERDYEIFGSEVMEMPVSEVIENAKEERYEVKVAQANLEMAQKETEIAKAAYWPSLAAFFNYNTRESGAGRIISGGLDPDEPYRQIGFVESTEEIVVAPNMVTEIGNPLPFFEQLQNNDGITYGVQLDIPIFNGFSTRNAVKRREVNVLRSEYQLEQTKLDLESDVYQAYVDAKGALKAYEAALVALEAQSLAYDYATERYNVGLTNAFDFSQAKFNFENAQSEVVRTKYEYIFNLKVLELYFGVPVTELKF